MNLSSEQKAQLQSLVDRVKCPICGSNKFTIKDDMVATAFVGPLNTQNGKYATGIGGTDFTLGAAICSECGFVHFFKL